jgi:hypothetical protein
LVRSRLASEVDTTFETSGRFEPLDGFHLNVRSICVTAQPAATDRIAQDKGKSKEEVTAWNDYPGGAPCNVACGLGKLDIPVAFVSCLGQDGLGDELMELMQSMPVQHEMSGSDGDRWQGHYRALDLRTCCGVVRVRLCCRSRR